jgi:hypothetical protein
MRMRQAAVVAAVAVASGSAGALGAAWFTGAAASQPSAGQPSTGQSSASLHGPVALVVTGYTGTRPSAIQFSVDGGNVVTRIRWSSWGDRTATGSGTVGRDDCIPNCAEGTTRYVPASITLSAPGAAGEWTVITETVQGHRSTFTMSGHWAQGATS